MRRSRILLLLACVAPPVACADATAIDVHVYSEVSCDKNAEALLTIGGSVDAVGGRAPSSTATTCEAAGDGTFRRGNVVIVPQQSTSEEIVFEITTRIDGQPVADLCSPGHFQGCIAEKRQLRFSPHQTLSSRIDLRLSCVGVDCPSNETCDVNSGLCVPVDNCGLTDCASRDGGIDAGPSAPPNRSLAIAPEGASACALNAAGGVRCWGSNGNFLGDGTTSMGPLNVTGLSSGVSAVCSGSDACALGSGGLSCWGINSKGELGVGDMNPRPLASPVPALSAGVVDVSCGTSFTCAVVSSGGAKCWGDDTLGQLGDGLVGSQATSPVDATGLSSGVAAVSAGASHACALLRTGAVVCWGDNSHGALGTGDTSAHAIPTPISSLSSGVVAVEAGFENTCAIVGSGLSCWGYNTFGQLGAGTVGIDLVSPTPVTTLGAGVAAVRLGLSSTCALLMSGAVKCWGSNLDGQLGDGTKTDSAVPVDVKGLAGPAVAVGVGGRFACARLATGAVQCWGYGLEGQLGDGTLTSSVAPVSVSGFP